uniref:Uncharacterized protein n=1 Tax=Romanomermis culicivorax TaxID=13658 RepID=A0A915I5W7_ROMCU
MILNPSPVAEHRKFFDILHFKTHKNAYPARNPYNIIKKVVRDSAAQTCNSMLWTEFSEDPEKSTSTMKRIKRNSENKNHGKNQDFNADLMPDPNDFKSLQIVPDLASKMPV